MDNEQREPLVHEKLDTKSKIFKNLDVPIDSDSNTVKLRIKTLLKQMNSLQDQIDKVKLENKSIEESRFKLALNFRRF
ncbi:MAG: hypothetical protein ACREAK_10940 [Nitrosarchaeum sp.]